MSNNIILMWPPWSWKTTLSRILWKKLNVVSFDIDDDHLETIWGTTVWEKLKELWDEEFIKMEWETMLGFQKQNSIIALTWSNPLHEEAMKHIRSLWTVVYLDVDKQLIMDRLHEMKINRIVWMKSESLWNILDYRKTFYEKYYDTRVMFVKNWEIEQKAEKILKLLNKNEDYVSTRWKDKKLNFLEVVEKWIAWDWWLFMLEHFPIVDERDLTSMLKNDYQKRALKILEKFAIWDMCPQELKVMIDEAYSEENFDHKDIVPTRKLRDNEFLVEIFHWPTAAFKDAALQLTPKFFNRAVRDTGKKYLILAATSWDTWVAAIEGYKNEPNVSVMVLYPKSWVSEVQKKQMLTSIWDNVFVLWIDWDFDFCQSTVKKIFNDKILRKELWEKFNTSLSSANSINWWRLLPQVVYHISSYLDLVNAWEIVLMDPVDICIPCWNFWNELAAFIVWKMWLPFRRFISASNENNVLTEFINTWIYDLRNRDIVKTFSPSCDILKASNIERLVYILSWNNSDLISKYMKDLEEKKYFEVSDDIKWLLKQYFRAWYCSNKDSLKVIKQTLGETWVLIDPHTAVAKKVADDFQDHLPMLISSTAHWAKFPQAVLKALDWNPEWKTTVELYDEILKKAPKAKVHSRLEWIDQKIVLHDAVCKADIGEIVDHLKGFLEKRKVDFEFRVSNFESNSN